MGYAPERTPPTFGGMERPTGSSPRVAILPVPYESTTSFGHGTADGPSAIIDASRHLELYDLEFQGEPSSVGIETFEPLGPQFAAPEEPQTEVREAVTSILKREQFPLLLGGEHSITPPAVEAVQVLYPDLSVLQLDAHADLRESFEGTRWSHACAMRRVIDLGVRVVQVGIRSMSAEEHTFLMASGRSSHLFPGHVRGRENAIELLSSNVYLTLDVDVLDPSVMPATGTPEPDGWSYAELLDFLRDLCRRRRVVAADVVEFAPLPAIHAPAFIAASLVYKLIGYRFMNH